MGYNPGIVNLRKNSRLDQDSNSGLQLYALARFRLRHPDKALGQARAFLLVDPTTLHTGSSAICPLLRTPILALQVCNENFSLKLTTQLQSIKIYYEDTKRKNKS